MKKRTETNPVPEHKPDRESIRLAYQETCAWYHKIDDFRAKLLGFLPFVSGAGLFLLLKNDLQQGVSDEARALLALTGSLVTVGLLIYELRGFQRCIRLRRVGEELERAMRLMGSFTLWPHSLAGFVNEPIAAAIIYPAVLAGWVHVATLYSAIHEPECTPYAVFVIAFLGVVAFFRFYRNDPHFQRDQYEKDKRTNIDAAAPVA